MGYCLINEKMIRTYASPHFCLFLNFVVYQLNEEAFQGGGYHLMLYIKQLGYCAFGTVASSQGTAGVRSRRMDEMPTVQPKARVRCTAALPELSHTLTYVAKRKGIVTKRFVTETPNYIFLPKYNKINGQIISLSFFPSGEYVFLQMSVS